jgi:hypothetical protein
MVYLEFVDYAPPGAAPAPTANAAS